MGSGSVEFSVTPQAGPRPQNRHPEAKKGETEYPLHGPPSTEAPRSACSVVLSCPQAPPNPAAAIQPPTHALLPGPALSILPWTHISLSSDHLAPVVVRKYLGD